MRLIRSIFANPRDRDVQKRLETSVSQFKNATGEVCRLTTCFLWVRSIILFLIYPQAWCIAWMLTRPKVTKPETQDRDVIIFKTETRPRRSIFPNSRDRDVQTSRPRRSRKRLETVSRPRRSRLRLHPWSSSSSSPLTWPQRRLKSRHFLTWTIGESRPPDPDDFQNLMWLPYFYEDPISSFTRKLLTEKRPNRQTNAGYYIP